MDPMHFNLLSDPPLCVMGNDWIQTKDIQFKNSPHNTNFKNNGNERGTKIRNVTLYCMYI